MQSLKKLLSINLIVVNIHTTMYTFHGQICFNRKQWKHKVKSESTNHSSEPARAHPGFYIIKHLGALLPWQGCWSNTGYLPSYCGYPFGEASRAKCLAQGHRECDLAKFRTRTSHSILCHYTIGLPNIGQSVYPTVGTLLSPPPPPKSL
jgi:hypothetical protein